METTRTPALARAVSPGLHAGATLGVALLAAAVLEEAHPLTARALADDPRHPWQRVLDLSALLRAGDDPYRALVLASRERASSLTGDPDTDEQVLAVRHALRVHLVLRTATLAGHEVPGPDAERYVREQVGTAVLCGSEPERVAGSVAEVDVVVGGLREDLRRVGGLGRLPSRQLSGPGEARVAGWRDASALAPAVLPDWAPHADVVLGRAALTRRLRRLDAAAAAVSPDRR
ncbi:hypothetical protein [Kineococcus rubinsiae]|uniref:hypothetical protein n=1 Tax=Kineococcus rubinsiae TaxID=2609562 RepID=UPI0014300D17|nr:hypothetical protein [Kineococcus rubinsiae]NIZ93190.1 hypothetical protein [Kineococcus rubinsiae]